MNPGNAVADTVFIVDDEQPVLDGISTVIQRSLPSATIAGTATSAKEAIEKILELRPRIVLVDIHMPGMDGIEMVRELRRLRSPAVFILVTAYERFDIAREAFGLGVYSYLVKPVRREKLVQTLVDAFTAIREREAETRAATDRRMEDAAVDRLLQSLFVDAATGRARSSYAETCAGLLALGDLTARFVAVEAPDGNPGYEAFLERLRFKYRIVAGEPEDERWLLFVVSGNQGPDGIRRTVLEAIDVLSGDPATRPVIGIGEPGLLREPGASIRSAFADLHENRLAELPQNDRGRSANRDEIRAALKACADAAVRGIAAKASAAYRVLEVLLFPAAPAIAKNAIAELAVRMYDQADSRPGVAGRPEGRRSGKGAGDLSELWGLEGTVEVLEWGRARMARVVEAVAENREYSPFVAKTLRFMEERYSEAIGLEEAARRAGVTPHYLSALFSEEVGETFTDRLIRIRIERAMALIREGELRMKEIASQVGYADPNYFSRLFKKIVGMPPSRFGLEDGERVIEE